MESAIIIYSKMSNIPPPLLLFAFKVRIGIHIRIAAAGSLTEIIDSFYRYEIFIEIFAFYCAERTTSSMLES